MTHSCSEAPVPAIAWRGNTGLSALQAPLSSQHLPALDGVRGVAILSVMCIHLSWLPTQTVFDRVVTAVTNCGWMGVDLFFVLSGFLITGILIDSKEAPSFFRPFYARRALRILPLYYAFVIFFVLVLPIRHGLTPTMRGLLTHQGWLWAHAVNIWAARDGLSAIPYSVGIAWSLSLEEQFYLVWPFVVRFSSRRALRWVCLACMAGAFVIRALIATRWPTAAYTLMPARMDALALGGLIAVTVREPDGPRRLSRLAAPAGAVAFGLIVVMYALRGNMRETDFSLGTLGYASADWLSASLLVLAVTKAPRALASRPLRFFGRYSYALYLFHLPVVNYLRPLEPWFQTRPLLLGSPILWMSAWMLLAAGITTSLALVSWICLERPILSLKRFFPYQPATSALLATPAAIQPGEERGVHPAFIGQ